MANTDLFDVWSKACTHYDVPEDVVRIWYERIRSKLSEEGNKRFYHNWALMLCSKKAELVHCKPHIVLAVFFQYYEFDVSRCCVQDNCKAFREFCQDASIKDDDMMQLVCCLLGEKESKPTKLSVTPEISLLHDLDLLILAAPAEDYRRYAELTSQEWSISGRNYKSLRRKILTTMLALDSIYATPEFNAKYERAARANIEQELKELQKC